MRCTVMAVAALALMGRSSADSAPRGATSGLAVGAGVGYEVVGLGVQALYYQSLGSRFWLAPYAGVGVFPYADRSNVSPAGGVVLAWGRKHRIVIDSCVGLGAMEGESSPLTGHILETRRLYGLTFAVGYEYVADGGFWIRPTAGAMYLLTKPRGDGSRWQPTLNVTLGYKIW